MSEGHFCRLREYDDYIWHGKVTRAYAWVDGAAEACTCWPLLLADDPQYPVRHGNAAPHDTAP